MRSVMTAHSSGYYAWKAEPANPRVQDDRRLYWVYSSKLGLRVAGYGYRQLTLGMRDLDESCGKHRVARLFTLERLRSQTGYKRRPRVRGGKQAIVAVTICSAASP